MNDVLALILFLGGMVGSILLAVYLILLPPRLFLRDERWLTEEEFRQAAPARAWCRHVPTIAPLVAFPTYAILFFVVKATCTNGLVFLMGMVPLFFLWIYVPVGVVELAAGVSVLVPIGRARGLHPAYIVGPRVARAGAFRLGVTAAVFAAVAVAAYW